MKISELYGMKVEKINSSRQGYVLCAFAEGERLDSILCCDENEHEFFIAAEDIISVNACLIYRNERKTARKRSALRLGIPCYDEAGKYLGVTQDYILNGAVIKRAQIGGKSYAYSRLISGDAVIVKSKRTPDVAATIAAHNLLIDATLS